MVARRRRSALIQKLSAQAKHTSTAVFIMIMAAAVILDLLGLAKEPLNAVPVIGTMLSGLLSWGVLVPGVFFLVTVPTYIAQLRIRRINRATGETVQATAAFRIEAQTLYQRLLPDMRRSKRAGLAASLDPARGPDLRARASYGKHLIMSQAWVLVLESIPIVSAGPWIFIKVLRVMAQQRKESHAARTSLAALADAERKIAALERVELAILRGDLETAVLEDRARLAAESRGRAAMVARTSASAGPLRPAYNAP